MVDKPKKADVIPITKAKDKKQLERTKKALDKILQEARDLKW